MGEDFKINSMKIIVQENSIGRPENPYSLTNVLPEDEMNVFESYHRFNDNNPELLCLTRDGNKVESGEYEGEIVLRLKLGHREEWADLELYSELSLDNYFCYCVKPVVHTDVKGKENHLPEVSNMVDIEDVRKVLMQNEFRIINGLLVNHIINQIRELKANN
jgi:hypothetical protein